MVTQAETIFFEDQTTHMAHLAVVNQHHNFTIETTKYPDAEQMQYIKVELLQKGTLDPIYSNQFDKMCVVGGSKINTTRFSPPSGKTYSTPFLLRISATSDEIDLSQFSFVCNWFSMLA